MTDLEHHNQYFEEQKVALDYVKHLSTLATSVIVFSVAFADKLASRHRWKWLLVPAFAGELLSLVALSLAAVGVISASRTSNRPSESLVRFTVVGTLIGLVAFLVGIGALSAFIVRNIA